MSDEFTFIFHAEAPPLPGTQSLSHCSAHIILPKGLHLFGTHRHLTPTLFCKDKITGYEEHGLFHQVGLDLKILTPPLTNTMILWPPALGCCYSKMSFGCLHRSSPKTPGGSSHLGNTEFTFSRSYHLPNITRVSPQVTMLDKLRESVVRNSFVLVVITEL